MSSAPSENAFRSIAPRGGPPSFPDIRLPKKPPRKLAQLKCNLCREAKKKPADRLHSSTSEYHRILYNRSSLLDELEQCICNKCQHDSRRTPRLVFEVSVSKQRLDVVIISQDLYSDLESFLQIGLRGVNETFNGEVLLKQYIALKSRLDELRRSPNAAKDLVDEWALLVEGFLGNRSAFRCFGFQELYESEFLDDQLREVFAQQELKYGIGAFDQAFVETDGRETGSGLDTRSPPVDEEDSKPLHGSTLYSMQEMEEWLEWWRGDREVQKREAREREAREREDREREDREREALERWVREREARERGENPTLMEILEKDKALEIERLRQFRLRFINQCQLLRQATQDPSMDLNLLSGQLQHHRGAWAAAVTAMRRLSRLEPPSLIGALYFLCVSRALAETFEDDGNPYTSAFTEDLKQWIHIFPEIETAARLMWHIMFDSSTTQPQTTAQQHATMLLLRESVAALIGKANGIFGLGDWSPHNGDQGAKSCEQATEHDASTGGSDGIERSDSSATCNDGAQTPQHYCRNKYYSFRWASWSAHHINKVCDVPPRRALGQKHIISYAYLALNIGLQRFDATQYYRPQTGCPPVAPPQCQRRRSGDPSTLDDVCGHPREAREGVQYKRILQQKDKQTWQGGAFPLGASAVCQPPLAERKLLTS
ncbi:hypothetical protein DL769_004118 [Monosporascus sp. CRB-8-3]|nr:hypothetical protein DL769_004118 [Monosporascus sp. CRB-8-3]